MIGYWSIGIVDRPPASNMTAEVQVHQTANHQASKEDMKDARLPIGFRDQCSALLIPLNECRRDTFFLPFKCEDLRHAYEKCQYIEYNKRVEILNNKK